MSLEDFTMKRVRRQFTVEFKKNAVSLVVDEKRSVSEVAKSLNISSKTLSTWLRQSREGKLEGKIASNVDEKTMQMAAIMAENQRLKAEVLLLKNSQRIFRKRASVRYAFILESLSDPDFKSLRLEDFCRVLEVSKSGYYAWKRRKINRDYLVLW